LAQLQNRTILGEVSFDELSDSVFRNSDPKTGTIDFSQFCEIFEAGLLEEEDVLFLHSLFGLFALSDGMAECRTLLSGLLMLCRGSLDSKTAAAFDLFSENDCLSFPATTQFFGVVFGILYHLRPDLEEALGFSAELLASEFVTNVFSNAGLDASDSLTLEQFRSWWVITEFPLPINCLLQEASIETNCVSFSAEELFEFFAQATDTDGFIKRDMYEGVLREISRKDDLCPLVAKIFEALDLGDGAVDFLDVCIVVAVLSSESQERTAMETFSLLDVGKDGMLSIEDARHYLVRICLLLHLLAPDQAYTTVDEGLRTLADCPPSLSLDVFLHWRKQWFPYQEFTAEELTEPWVTETDFLGATGLGSPTTGLGALNIDQMFELFASVTNPDGLITRDDLQKCFAKSEATESNMLIPTTDLIYDLFREDESDMMDFSELCSGLALFCQGTPVEKASACFSLFDFDNTDTISTQELARYVSSVFRINELGLPAIGVDLEVIVRAAVADVVQAYGVEEDGSISRAQFEEACAASLFELKSWSWLGLDQARLLLGLENVTVEHVFQLFAMSTNDDGYLSKDAYIACFVQILNQHPLLSSMGPVERARAIHVVQVLFDIFATESADFVDFTAICTGVAVLFGDYRQHVDGTVFSLYDYEEKGAIGLDDMIRYLSCIFRVMYALQPGTSMRMGVGVFELAHATAAEAFESSTLTKDGDLPFDEFLRWYNKPVEPTAANETAVLSLIEIRRLTNMVRYPIDEVFEVFAQNTNADGFVDFEAFVSSFEALARGAVLSEEDLASRNSLLVQLFNVFDVDNEGHVDFTELMSALSIFCVGPKLEKIQAVFTLYDYNERGYIAPDETNRYFRSVFRMFFALQPHMQKHVGISAEDLARLMTQRCFAECLLGEDGRASFDSFASWLLRGNFGETDLGTIDAEEETSSDGDSESDERVEHAGVVEHDGGNELPGFQFQPSTTLAQVRQLTKFEEFSAQEVCDIFAEQSSNDGVLTLGEFREAAQLIAECGGGHESESDERKVKKLHDDLFRAFDVNGDGVVTYEELLSGILVLCGGSRDDKVKTAFELFDRDGNGSITIDEMEQYLTSVFRILYEISPNIVDSVQATAEELGKTTAAQCFEDVDINHDGEISYDEFAQWYLAPRDDNSGSFGLF